MFKPARWWSDKNKLKVVFKLQFHASQVTQVGGDGLMISVVPAVTGKLSAKSGKATVRDGSCLWENPIYETVKFNQDPKSGKIHERIYYFVVNTGSSKPGFFGEASIDFSNYVEASKASSVSLPLKHSNSEAVLHVLIQRVHESIDQREIEENENGNFYLEDQSSSPHLGSHDTDRTVRSDFNEDVPSNTTVSQAEFNKKRQASSGSDVTLLSSEGSSGIEAPWELKNCNIHQDWQGNSGLEDSTDDSSSTIRETFLQEPEEAPDIVIEKLKADVAALSRQAEMSELELQSLRKQVVRESKRGQDLWREVIRLKEERDALKGETEQLKAFKTKANLLHDGVDSRVIVEELRQELYHVKEMNANLRIQLEKTQESNSELILAVRDLEEMLEQKNGERDMDETSREVVTTYRPNYDDDEDDDDDDDDDDEQKALEDLVKEHDDAQETSLLEQQILDLCSEIEIYKRDKDELEMQMEALALDYEIMKQANHEISYKLEQSHIQEQLKMQYEYPSPDAAAHELETSVENLENELEIRSKEYEDSLVMISELQAHAKSLEEELEKQARGFEADLEAVTRSKIEQEQRAIRSEETLKKIRWRNANTAERLQEEFRKLSVQMASSFEANEKLATKAMAEANELRLQKSHLEEMLKRTSEEHQSIEGHYETRLQQLTSQVTVMTNQIEQMELMLEHQKKNAEDTQKVLKDEVLMLKEEIEAHIAKNEILSEEIRSKEALMHELDRMRTSIKEMELLVEQGNDEKTEIENKVLLVKTEAEGLHKELIEIKCLLKEKESKAENLQSELDSLKAHCTELRNSVLDDEAEKEKLRKQVLQLKSDLKKKEDFMEKKTKDGRGRATTANVIKATSKNNKTHPRETKEVVNLKERLKFLESQIKLKETALETSANAFIEKEKDLHNQIDKLNRNLELKSARLFENDVEKSAVNCPMNEEARLNDENLSNRSNDLSKVQKDSANATADVEELKNETTLLRERNKLMERDLKEMQERYLDISLKFAEVEGERQQLVMKLRNHLNTCRSA